MARMGKYCKAYLAKQFREYSGWSENAKNVRKGHELNDDSILYLQENYVVTDGIFMDEYIIFDNVTDEWKGFCYSTLNFEIPVYEPINIQNPQSSEGPTGENT